MKYKTIKVINFSLLTYSLDGIYTNENISEFSRSSSDNSVVNKLAEKELKFNFTRLKSNDNNSLRKKEDTNIEEFEGMFNNSNFKFNMNQSNFMNFYKKKEMENLETQIKQVISDIIEINTDSINSILDDILSKSRGDILKKSWGQNNKKLLLFEINRNYKSLVDKIYLFSAKSQRENNSLFPNSARHTYGTSRKYSRSQYNSLSNINTDNLEIPSDGGDESKRKVKEELIEFKKMKDKIIKNFFDLSDTQISGDAVRDWLYENSKY